MANKEYEAEKFIVTGGVSTEFLKGDGTVDSGTYTSGAGTAKQVAYYNSANVIKGEAGFEYNEGTNTFSSDIIEANTYRNVPIMITSNFNHATNTALTYYNIGFNSLTESITAGEQHFWVAPAAGRVRSIAMKNTSTGTTPTATTNKVRVVKNGTTLYTSSNSMVGGGASGMSSAFGLGDSAATFTTLDMIQIQFQANGLWYDTAVTIIIELT